MTFCFVNTDIFAHFVPISETFYIKVTCTTFLTC